MKLLVALLMLLVFAAPASADWKQDRALQISRIVWHNPCVDAAKFTVVTQEKINRGTVLAANENVAARGDARTCTILISDQFLPENTLWMSWCLIVLHEAGHLANFRDLTNTADPVHSSNPHSVMYATPFEYGDARCDRNGRPFLERHGALTPRLPRHKKLDR